MAWKNLKIDLSLVRKTCLTLPNREECDYSGRPFDPKKCKDCGNWFRTSMNYYNHHCWPKKPKVVPPVVRDVSFTVSIIRYEMAKLGIRLLPPVQNPDIPMFFSVLNQFQKLFADYRDKQGIAVICFYLCKFVSYHLDYLRYHNKYVYESVCKIVLKMEKEGYYFGHFVGIQQPKKDIFIDQVFIKNTNDLLDLIPTPNGSWYVNDQTLERLKRYTSRP